MNRLITRFPCTIKYQGKECRITGLFAPYYSEKEKDVNIYYICQDEDRSILLDPTGIDDYEIPKILESYWYISIKDSMPVAIKTNDIRCPTDIWRRQGLNYFKTKEEAETILSKIEFVKQ